MHMTLIVILIITNPLVIIILRLDDINPSRHNYEDCHRQIDNLTKLLVMLRLDLVVLQGLNFVIFFCHLINPLIWSKLQSSLSDFDKSKILFFQNLNLSFL